MKRVEINIKPMQIDEICVAQDMEPFTMDLSQSDDSSQQEAIQEEKSKRKRRFTKEEDLFIQNAVEEVGYNWKDIAAHLKDKTWRQVKERYLYFLAPNINRGLFTKEEDKQLDDLVGLFGTKWSMIAKYFDGRSPISLKNRYNRVRKEVKVKELFPIPMVRMDNIFSVDDIETDMDREMTSFGLE